MYALLKSSDDGVNANRNKNDIFLEFIKFSNQVNNYFLRAVKISKNIYIYLLLEKSD